MLAAAIVLGFSVFLVLRALDNRIVFFLSPSDIANNRPEMGRKIRIGGLVVAGSLTKLGNDGTLIFSVTDMNKNLLVRYRGVLPDLFREGQGIVAEGAFDQDNVFVASEILAKHDENYMPPEVAKALKKEGRWQETGGQSGTPSMGLPALGSSDGQQGTSP